MDYPDRPKPKTFEEVEQLIASGDIEVMIQEDIDEQLTRMLICDNRRSYEEGEIYEIIV